MHQRAFPFALALACAACAPSKPANVILIVVDTLRADHTVPIEGKAKTPAIESLAIDGTRFEHAFSHAPMTLPAHAALFSSRLPHEADVRINGAAVDEQLPLLAEWLTHLGYESLGAVSLATMWPHGEGQDLARGFEKYEFDLAHECESAETMKARFDAALAARDKDKPFFLFAHLSDPHEPYDARGTAHSTANVALDGKSLASIDISIFAPLALNQVNLHTGDNVLEITADARFKLRKLDVEGPNGPIEVRWENGQPRGVLERARATLVVPPGPMLACRMRLWVQEALSAEVSRERYRLEVEHCDAVLGAFLDELRTSGLYQQSWIVFTSDHGEALGEHGVVGHVVDLYDELLHVPLIVKAPDRDPASLALKARRDALARHIDIVPTLLDGLHLPPMPGQTGVSLLRDAPTELVAETFAPLAPADLFCIRDQRFKLIYAPAAQRFELYDLGLDPNELHATDGEHDDWRERLRRLAGSIKPLDASSPELPDSLRALGY
jgi:arylsulfatase A-like enzyme